MIHVIADIYAQDTAEKTGNDDPSYILHGVFPSAGDDQWIAIAIETDAQADALKRELGVSTLDTDVVGEATLAHDKFALFERLSTAGIPAGPVLDGKNVSENPELAAASHFVKLDHPALGPSNMPAPPYALRETPWAVTRSPLLGEHNREVFVVTLGLDETEIETLIAEGSLA
jgi:benzylsuccinate CoA-transferase BbsF subunit